VAISDRYLCHRSLSGASVVKRYWGMPVGVSSRFTRNQGGRVATGREVATLPKPGAFKPQKERWTLPR
jgi:hypothetical protein